MEYLKPFKSFEELADIIISRGMKASKDDLVEHLKDVGYYRLSGYWHIFRSGDGETFKPGTEFSKVWDLYVFDRQLRLVVFDAIERFEIYLKTQLAHILAEETGPFGFEDRGTLPNLDEDLYEHRLIERCKDAYGRSREPFAVHFRVKYGDCHELPPYWMLVNLMDFGTVVTLFKGAPNHVRARIARDLGVQSAVLDSWVVCLNTVRNIVAHHGRLWNRVLGTKPVLPRKKNDGRWYTPYRVKQDKVFAVLTILSYLLTFIAPDTSWRTRLLDLLDTRSERELRMMGFANGWEECPFWKPWLAGREG